MLPTWAALAVAGSLLGPAAVLGQRTARAVRLQSYVPPFSGDAQEWVFPKTSVGASSPRQTNGYCFADSNGNCGQPGSVALKSPIASPFSVKTFRKCPSSSACSCSAPAINLPATLSGGEDLCFDLVFSPTAPFTSRDVFAVGELDSNAQNLAFYLYGAAPNAFNCQENDTTACLSKGRFKLTAKFSAPAGGALQTAHVVRRTADTAFLWFFAPDNIEAVIKVINGCGLNNRYWVFAGGLTNVHVEITLTDTKNGQAKTLSSPQGPPFSPIQNTSAFATCP